MLLVVMALAAASPRDLADRVADLIELDDGLSTITARLDAIEIRQENSLWRWTTGTRNLDYLPALRDRKRALRSARVEITQAMLLEWDPWEWSKLVLHEKDPHWPTEETAAEDDIESDYNKPL